MKDGDWQGAQSFARRHSKKVMPNGAHGVNFGNFWRIEGGMKTSFQPLELNGLRRGNQQVSRQSAMIEERNRLEREHRRPLALAIPLSLAKNPVGQRPFTG